MARKGRRATFEEKIFALRLLEQGMSPDRVAEALGVGRESVFRWKRQARAGGDEALRIKKAPGRPRRLTPGQEQSVKAVVRDVTPRQVLGTAVALWTRALVAMVTRPGSGSGCRWRRPGGCCAGWACHRNARPTGHGGVIGRL